MSYLWQNISDYDLEQLGRDLLESTVGGRLEMFRRGPDGGIDLRYTDRSGLVDANGNPPVTIVQCKHYPNSSFSDLKKSVVKEKEKLDAMAIQPRRYLLFTTFGLTPSNKTELQRILGTHLRGVDDLLGVQDIEGLLSANPTVERHHFKLWLTSGDRLQAIHSAAIFNRAEMLRGQLLKKSKLFVQTEKFGDARKLLGRSHVCIIAGPAGVGKTTLAEMLILEYLSDGFSLSVISDDIEEAERTLMANEKQLFYYDDFLGRTNLAQPLNKNEDKRLLEFIRHVEATNNKRFILTTREYLLQYSRRRFDNLQNVEFDTAKLSITVGSYSKVDRARILYNHLYYDEHVTPADLREMINQRAYDPIIRHKNFNPRMIESALSLRRAQSKE